MLAKWKRTLLLLLILAVTGTAAVTADSVYETIQAKKTNVTVNGEPLGGRSLEVNGKVMVPLDQLAGSLQSIVLNDGNQVNIYKPNVHMAVLSYTKNGLVLLSAVSKDSKHKFVIHTQGDSLSVGVKNLKFEIIDPRNQIVYEEIVPVSDNVQESFLSYTSDINLNFEHAGDYTIKAYMQLKDKSDYHLVSKKVIQSLAK